MENVRRRWTWHLKKRSNDWSHTSSRCRSPAPPLMQGLDLPTWRLSQTEGRVQKVQGRVDTGLSQALYGSLVTGTQQVLTSVPGLCPQSKGRADRKSSLGIPRGEANSKTDSRSAPKALILSRFSSSHPRQFHLIHASSIPSAVWAQPGSYRHSFRLPPHPALAPDPPGHPTGYFQPI